MSAASINAASMSSASMSAASMRRKARHRGSRLTLGPVFLALALACSAPVPESPAPKLPDPPELPDLSLLDPPVREQFERQHQILTRVLADERADDRHKAEAYGQLGRIYHAYSNHAVAGELYRAANLLDPGEARWPHLLGLTERDQGRYEASTGAFRAALELRPGDLGLNVYLAENALHRQALDEAEIYFRAALDIDARCLRARLGLGRVLLGRDQAQQAIELLEKAYGESNSSEIQYSLAMAYRQVGNLGKAQELLDGLDTSHLTRRPLTLTDPTLFKLQDLRLDATHFEHRGLKAIARKDFRQAVTALRRTVSIDPDRKEARVNLALALLRLGLSQEAENHLTQALSTDPDFVPALRTLSRLLERSGRVDRARELQQRAETVETRDASRRGDPPTDHESRDVAPGAGQNP